MTVKAQSDNGECPLTPRPSDQEEKEQRSATRSTQVNGWLGEQTEERRGERQTQSNDRGRQVLGGSDFIWLTSSDRGR